MAHTLRRRDLIARPCDAISESVRCARGVVDSRSTRATLDQSALLVRTKVCCANGHRPLGCESNVNAPAPKTVRNCHVTEKLPPQASPPPILAQPTPYPDLAKARSAAGSVAAAPITIKKGLPGLRGQKKQTVPSTQTPPRPHAALLRSHIFLPGPFFGDNKKCWSPDRSASPLRTSRGTIP